MQILVLEGDRFVGEAFRETLAKAGHAVMLCHDNDTAVEALFTGVFDLVIADLMIGDETSIPTLDCARAFCPQAEIILVTSSTLFPSGEMHYAISHVAYRIQKPVRPEDLAALAAHCARTAAPQDEEVDLAERRAAS